MLYIIFVSPGLQSDPLETIECLGLIFQRVPATPFAACFVVFDPLYMRLCFLCSLFRVSPFVLFCCGQQASSSMSYVHIRYLHPELLSGGVGRVGVSWRWYLGFSRRRGLKPARELSRVTHCTVVWGVFLFLGPRFVVCFQFAVLSVACCFRGGQCWSMFACVCVLCVIP